MARHDEAYAYGIIRQAALIGATEATNRRDQGRHLKLAAFAQRSARLIGATA